MKSLKPIGASRLNDVTSLDPKFRSSVRDCDTGMLTGTLVLDDGLRAAHKSE